MKRIRFVSGSRMSRRHFVSAQDAQSRSLELFEQLRAGPQARDAPPGRKGSTTPHRPARDALAAPAEIRAAFGFRDRRFRFPWASSAARESMAGCRPRAPRDPREKGPPARHRCVPKTRAVERSHAHTPTRVDRDRSRSRVRCHAVRVPRRAHRCPCRYRKQRLLMRTRWQRRRATRSTYSRRIGAKTPKCG